MSIWKTIIVLILLGPTYSCKERVQEKVEEVSKPNVILVITDDQGYGDVGAHGNELIKTPNIDNFYKESIHFTDFHVGPTCAPTRAALMTGRYANSTGVWHTVGGWSLLRENEKTLANMFEDAGYKTGAFGKWHLGDNYPFRAEHRGFQTSLMHGGGGVQQTPDYWDNDYFDDTYFENGIAKKQEGYCTDVFFNRATQFIASHKEEPFFCYISSNAPHGPYNVPLNYYDLYKDLNAETLNDQQKRFYGMITNIDDNFGKLRSALKEFGIADNTILIFMTDNGTSSGYYNKNGDVKGFNAGMRGTKGSEYEGGHRVPFFIYWNKGNISGGRDINELTSHIDIMPTLAELCGIELPKDHLTIDGISLVPIMNGEETETDRMLVTDSQRLQRPKKWKNGAVMQNNWRLINGRELYNLEKDKGQEHDLAEEFPEKVIEMRAFYDNWWTQVSVDFEKEIYFKIGHKKENPVILTAHDVHAENGQQPWNQIQIRNGAQGSGYWSIEVLQEGNYEIALRRYPIESGLAINASIEGLTTKQQQGLEFDIPRGKPMDYEQASITIGNEEHEYISIEPNASEVSIDFDLKKGKTTLQASFINANGEENIAYYVYVRKK